MSHKSDFFVSTKVYIFVYYVKFFYQQNVNNGTI